MSKVFPLLHREHPDFGEGYGVFAMHYHLGQGSDHYLLNVLTDKQTAAMEASILGSELDCRYDDTAGDEPTPYHELSVVHWDFPQLRLTELLPRKNSRTDEALVSIAGICNWEPECQIDSYIARLAMDARFVGLWAEES